MKHAKTIARKFHNTCNELESKYLTARKTAKRSKRLRQRIEFELQWHIALGYIDYKLSEEQVIIAIKRYRSKYER